MADTHTTIGRIAQPVAAKEFNDLHREQRRAWAALFSPTTAYEAAWRRFNAGMQKLIKAVDEQEQRRAEQWKDY